MRFRDFRGDNISEVGLGTWQLGSADWGMIDEGHALQILTTYADLGGNFIDTADVYGMGTSERIIGKFLKQTDKKFFVATKLGRRHDGANGWPQNFSYDSIRRHVEESLQKLGVDQLFLEQLHCIPTDELRSGKVFDHLRKLQQEGLIKHFGVSVETSEEALICLEHRDIASLQVIFNLFRQHLANDFFERAHQQNTAIIARVPLASGLLSGRFNKQSKFKEQDHRHYNANGEAFNVGETFSGIEFNEGLDFVNELKKILPEGNLAQQSIKWILQHPAVTTVIPGASKPEQVYSNTMAAGLPDLDTSVLSKLRELYDQRIRRRIRGAV